MTAGAPRVRGIRAMTAPHLARVHIPGARLAGLACQHFFQATW